MHMMRLLTLLSLLLRVIFINLNVPAVFFPAILPLFSFECFKLMLNIYFSGKCRATMKTPTGFEETRYVM